MIKFAAGRVALALIRLVSRIGCRPDKTFTPPSGNMRILQNILSIFSSFRFIVLFPALCKPGEPS
ncbi:hypothetical protein AB9H28_23680, partial [Salmonella enterica subsp. enterica serovar Kentucky]|uniref:hypothetical protein n=1 Tax=Salmonella enterica TaxID=28901 RepID=UPI003F4C56E5